VVPSAFKMLFLLGSKVVTFAIVMLKKEVPIKNVFSNLLSTYV
jgi:hypothetical protein